MTKSTPEQTPDFAAFPLAAKGYGFSEHTPGRVFRHHWGRTLTEADNVIFSTALCDWNPLYLNAEYATHHGFDGAVMNPMLVLCVCVGLSVEDLSEANGAFLGLDDCEFGVPVYAGDTIVASSVVLAARPSSSRPAQGVITWRTTAVNQRDEMVVQFVRSNLSSAPRKT